MPRQKKGKRRTNTDERQDKSSAGTPAELNSLMEARSPDAMTVFCRGHTAKNHILSFIRVNPRLSVAQKQ